MKEDIRRLRKGDYVLCKETVRYTSSNSIIFMADMTYRIVEDVSIYNTIRILNHNNNIMLITLSNPIWNKFIIPTFPKKINFDF